MEKKKRQSIPTDALVWHLIWLPVLISDLIFLLYWKNHPVEACSWKISQFWYCQMQDVPLTEIIAGSIVAVIVWYQAEQVQRRRWRMLIRALIPVYLFPGRMLLAWFIQNAPAIFAVRA